MADEKEKKVVVSEKTLKEMMSTLQDLKANNKMLLQVADKKQLALYYSRNQKKMPAEVCLRVMDVPEMVEDPNTKEKKPTGKTVEKVIVGWRTTEDRVYKDPMNNVWKEIQKVEVLFEDGTSKEMFLSEYNSSVTGFRYVKCTRTGVITDEQSGTRLFKLVRQDNGKEYTVSELYVN